MSNIPLSAFISYGGPDEKFAGKINTTLRKAGISTFFFPLDAQPGAKLHHMMRDGISKFDRVIFICSKSSLTRNGVLNELEETLQREAREGGKQILIPITIDDYVFTLWNPDRPGLKQAILDRVVADFSKSTRNKTNFARATSKLLSALGIKQEIAYKTLTINLDIKDKEGRLADWTIERKFIVQKEVREIVYSGLNSTGQIVPKFSNIGHIRSMEKEGGSQIIYIDLANSLPLNEVITHKLELLLENAFMASKESYTYQVTYTCDEAKLLITVPKERTFKKIRLKHIRQGEVTFIDGIKLNADSTLATLAIKNPLNGDIYTAEWEW